jgi:hypothetical protein
MSERIAAENGVVKPVYGRPGPPFKMPAGFEGPCGFENDSDDDESSSVGAGSPAQKGVE